MGASIGGGMTSATYVPEPWRPSSQPSAKRRAYAFVTTVLLTPRVADRSRLDGSRSPARSAPPVTAAWSWADIWAASGVGAARSTTTGRPDGKVVIGTSP